MSDSTSSSPTFPILLLKTRSQPNDNYENLFSSPASQPGEPAFNPTFIPVLKHKINTDPALSWIQSPNSPPPLSSPSALPPHDRPYGGLIFTSQRAVEAFAAAFETLDPPVTSSDPPFSLPDLEIPLYVVGPATSKAVSAVASKRLPECTVLGSDTGNGEELANFILDQYQSSRSSDEQSPRDPLLFLVGEQRRDIIPRTLQDPNLAPSRQVRVDERVVYETGVEESFEEDFRKELDNALSSLSDSKTTEGNPASESRQVWIVVFSPTGCEAMLRVLGWDVTNKSWKEGSIGASSGSSHVRVATIGPTTRDHLKRVFSFEPDVCAPKPSPEGVKEGILAFWNRDRKNAA